MKQSLLVQLKTLFSLVCFLLLSQSAIAQSIDDCFNPNPLKNLCMFIDSRTKDPSPKGNYEFLYQRKILDAACVEVGKDSPTVIREKIGKLWDKFEGKLICNSLQFDVANGNIIKYAITTLFDEFVQDMVTWKVNLNKVDDSDGKTVLDYLHIQIQKNSGNALEEKFQNYYKLLREAGAKHKFEL
jgi:hypothetical protein